MNTTQWTVLRKVWRYIQRYRLYLVASLLLAAVTVVLTLFIPKLIGQAIDYMLGKGQVQFEYVGQLMIQILLFTVVTMIAQWLMTLCNNKMTYAVVSDLRNAAFDKLASLPLRYIDAHPHGEIESRVIADADQFADGLLMGFTQLFSGVLTIVGTVLFMLSVNVSITLVVMLLTPFSFVVASYIARHTYQMFQKQSETRGEQTALVNEMIEGAKVIAAFGQKEKVVADFDEVNARLTHYSLRAIFFSSITNPATRFVNSLVYTGVGLFGAFAALNGQLTVGQLTAFLSYANQYTKPFNEISGVVTELQNALACAARLLELIEEPAESADVLTTEFTLPAQGAVTFDHVAFSYDDAHPLVSDFSLQVKPGQKVAIVGPTGSGKTTLINLLMRFYEVNSGSILLDGVDIREIPRKTLRSAFGMVLQETWLKTGTIRDNITMGNPTISEEEMIRIAKICHIDHFVSRLPQGYDTIVSESGEDFSQGQRQLLCIARVMMSQPSMLILDEATSSIDTRTEMKIQEAFNHLMEGKTSFIVAHRLSTIQSADVILVLKDGQIIEQGTHEFLLAQQGFYAHLYHSQWEASS